MKSLFLHFGFSIMYTKDRRSEGVVDMIYTALISARIFLDDDGDPDIEPLTSVDDNHEHNEIFDDIDQALLAQIDPVFDKDGNYYFMAIVKAEFTKDFTPEGGMDYDIDYDVQLINSLNDVVI